MKFFVEKLLRLLLLEDLLFKNIIIFHKRLLQKLNTVSNGVSKDVDPISTCKSCLILVCTLPIITCLLVVLCLVTVSLICLTSALVIPPMTNNRIQSLVAGLGRAELINKLCII